MGAGVRGGRIRSSLATMSELPEHVLSNRRYWDAKADSYVAAARRDWAAEEPSWGIWRVPEPRLRMLPADPSGLDAIELGCGTAYVSSWLARRGAHPVGIDNSERQLQTARAMQAEHGLDFELIHGNAERVPRPDASFDFAISEYGASIWCDPELWIPEAARLLRPSGRLVFLVNSVLMMLCSSDSERSRWRGSCSARSSGCVVSSGPTTRASSTTSLTAS